MDLQESVADADVVIEAVPEQMDLKREVFSELDQYAPEGAILASNTSSLSITEIADATDCPTDVVGLHFFNPPVKMDLVEVPTLHRTILTVALLVNGPNVQIRGHCIDFREVSERYILAIDNGVLHTRVTYYLERL